MITPQLKDEILKGIITNSPKMQYETDSQLLAEEFQTEPEVIDGIVEQFHKKGFVKIIGSTSEGGWFLQVQADAHDYILKGGHLGEFEFLEQQVQKLKNDLSAYESSIPSEKFNAIQTTLNTIIAAASAFHLYK